MWSSVTTRSTSVICFKISDAFSLLYCIVGTQWAALACQPIAGSSPSWNVMSHENGTVMLLVGSFLLLQGALHSREHRFPNCWGTAVVWGPPSHGLPADGHPAPPSESVCGAVTVHFWGLEQSCIAVSFSRAISTQPLRISENKSRWAIYQIIFTCLWKEYTLFCFYLLA